MLRFFFTAFMIWACYLLQTSVFAGLSLGGILPNLMIVITSSFGFMRGEKEGMLVGFFSGLLVDICSGEMLGLYAIILLYIGFLNGKFSKIFYPEDIKLPLALIFTSDITYGLICYVLLFLLQGKFAFVRYLTGIILPEAVYTILVTLLLYPLILKINERLELREKRRA